MRRNLMIVGIDVFHDPARKDKSIYGFVASMNRTYSRWYTTSVEQVTN